MRSTSIATFVVFALCLGCGDSFVAGEPAPPTSSATTGGGSGNFTPGTGGTGGMGGMGGAGGMGGTGGMGGMGGVGGAIPSCVVPDVLRADSGHCYRYFPFMANWNDALSACQGWRDGGSLVTVNDGAESAFILQSVKPPTANALIGLNDLDDDNNFTWASGEISDFDGWANGQPNHSFNGFDEDAAAYWLDSNEWHDIPVASQVAFLCEAPQ